MLYPNSGHSTKLNSSDFGQSDYIEKRRQKMSGSGGLNQSHGASSNINPLSNSSPPATTGASTAIGTLSLQAQNVSGSGPHSPPDQISSSHHHQNSHNKMHDGVIMSAKSHHANVLSPQ